MPYKIYVGNLAWLVTSEMLRELFEPYGQVVSAEIVTDRRNGRHRGFAFVRMASAEAARQAIAELHGRHWHDRPLKVAPAKDPLQLDSHFEEKN